MRFPITDEMRDLEKIFKPYEDGCHLAENAPEEAEKARNKFSNYGNLKIRKILMWINFNRR